MKNRQNHATKIDGHRAVAPKTIPKESPQKPHPHASRDVASFQKVQKIARINKIIFFIIIAIIFYSIIYGIRQRENMFSVTGPHLIRVIARHSLYILISPFELLFSDDNPLKPFILIFPIFCIYLPTIIILSIINAIRAIKLSSQLRKDPSAHKIANQNLLFSILTACLIILIIVLAFF